MKQRLPIALFGGCALVLGILRWVSPERSTTYTGPRALLDAAFAIGLLALVLLLAGGLGRTALRWLKGVGATRWDQIVFGLPLGLGILAYGVLALGLVGLLRPWSILAWLAAASIWSYREWSHIIVRLLGALSGLSSRLKRVAWRDRLLLAVAGLLLALGILQALTPPWSYDALMYHLQGPKLFLQSGRLLLLPETWQANGPFTIQMLFTIGLALGCDTFARLMHLSCAVCLVLATFAFGRCRLGDVGGIVGAILLLAVPTLPVWASAAYGDLAWALYEFLALFSLFNWQENRERPWLALAGVMMGFALGSKYLAIGGLGVLSLWILWQDWRRGWSQALRSGIVFGGIAVLVAAPWYIKNWLWGGNPLYPLLFGGLGWDAMRVSSLTTYLRSFGTGHQLQDYLLLPLNLTLHNERFSTFWGDSPGPLLLVTLLYPIRRAGKAVDSLAVIAGARFILWALGSQQSRFLLPVLPAAALLSAAVLIGLASRFRTRSLQARLPIALALAALLPTTFAAQLVALDIANPVPVILGHESKDSFLRRTVGDHRAVQYVRQTLTDEERILLLWDGQGYYCDERCVPDADQSAWTRLVSVTNDPQGVAAQLLDDGIGYLALSLADAVFFQKHDPTQQHSQAFEFLLEEFAPLCGSEIYADGEVILFEITCQNDPL